MVSLTTVGKPTPMGTAWTYQGRLMDANGPADGRYDLQFALFTDPILSSSQIGPTVDVNDLDIIDGYFTTEVDFGSSVFNGDARWLEISVRPWDSEERHTLLSPRQEVTPTPYALHTRGIFVDDSGNVGIGTKLPDKKLTVAYGDFSVYPGQSEPSIITDGYNIKLGDSDGIGNQVFLEIDDPCNKFVFSSGNVGIGTSEPEEKLHVEGNVQIYGSLSCKDGVTGYSDLTTGNNMGVVGWAWTPTTGTNFAIYGHASNTLGPAYAGYFAGDVYASGKVGIGTASPVSKLDVAGGCITGSMCSDIRLKKNIEPLPLDDSILDRVMGLQAVTFEWKHRDDGKRQIGLIAQDVEEVFPEVVTTPDDDSCEKGLLTIGLDAVLVEAIKELKVENELLKDQLKVQNLTLKKRLNALEKMIRQKNSSDTI
jgi:hypothetical protein